MNRFVLPGAGVCAVLALVSALGVGPLGLLELLFLLAAWVIMPLGLAFVPDNPAVRLARRIQPAAAILTTISFFLPTGLPAAALAAPWAILNGLVALGGLLTVKEAFRGGLPSLLILAAMMFPPVGGIHLVSSRLGHPLSGFPSPSSSSPPSTSTTRARARSLRRHRRASGPLATPPGRRASAWSAARRLAAGFLFFPAQTDRGGILVISILAAARPDRRGQTPRGGRSRVLPSSPRSRGDRGHGPAAVFGTALTAAPDLDPGDGLVARASQRHRVLALRVARVYLLS
jgi:hypothetical protein